MTKYICDDGNGELEIEADSAQEAAQEYVDRGDWGNDGGWVDVYVTERLNDCDHPRMVTDNGIPSGTCAECGESCTCPDGEEGEIDSSDCIIHGDPESNYGDRERIKIAIDVPIPDCDDNTDHDWQSPIEVVGGIDENPGVYGHGGGVIMTEVCSHCGTYRVTDTWAQDRATGEQGLESVEYRDADSDSLAFVRRGKEKH